MDTAITTTSSKAINRIKGIAIEDIVKYADQGLTHSEIAKLVGCDKSNVTRRLQSIGYQGESTRDYKQARADIFAAGQHKLIRSVTDADIKKSSMLQRITAAGILYDKERLERGQATSNVAVVGELRGFLMGEDTPDEPVVVTPDTTSE